ncbi:tetratricopeptide repeat protein [Endozoicomonas sp. SESOKO1]|uniref:tetratricopeptide repeat protein n=1 Tax=Endozoicomonas sp. SESOKO1 TaxID=2828742 RepID=UPI002148A874|nr:tetratricopeptide repeat protein [Endozoicomonas sp. SESOKO1]
MRIREVVDSKFKFACTLIKANAVVAIAGVVLIIACFAGGFAYWQIEQTKKVELAQRQKVAKENGDKNTYANDFKKVFSGLTYRGLSSFYEQLWLDRIYFQARNWELNTLECRENCKLLFKKGDGELFTVVDIIRDGKPVKPQFDQQKLEFSYASEFRTQLYPELTTDASYDKSKVFHQCTTKITELYNLQSALQRLSGVSLTIGFPKRVTNISGYHWVMNADTQYGTISITGIDLDSLSILDSVLSADTVLTDLSVTDQSVKLNINYFCL